MIALILGIAILQIPAIGFAAANLASGYEMRVRFDRTLSSKSARVGDKFIATVVDPGPFNGARISGHLQSIRQSEHFKNATVMYVSFDRIRFRDGEAYPISAEIVRLYDLPSGEQVDAADLVDTRRRRSAQMLKRTGIGALTVGIFAPTLGGGGDAAIRPRLAGEVGAGIIESCGRKEVGLDQGVEMLLRIYPTDARGYFPTVARKPQHVRYPSLSLASVL
ncbi:MAG: hypothetical protein ACRD6N_10415 [Pyrinomonadaceae bacterium]